jgi:hypothetical protein
MASDLVKKSFATATWLAALGLALAGCLNPSKFSGGGGIDAMASGGRGGAAAGGHAGTPGTAGHGAAGSGAAGDDGGRAGSGTAGHGGAGSGAAGNGGRAGSGAAGHGAAGAGAAGNGGRAGNGVGGVGGAAGVAGAVGGGGSAGAAAGGAGGRACPAEQCNGRDDDCDGIVDNGCPIDGQPLGTRSSSTTSPAFGGLTYTDNTGFTDACPDGQAIIGLTGNAGAGLDAMGVQCGVVQVREDRTSDPFKYSIAVTAGFSFPPAGGGGGSQHLIDSLLLCGPDEVVAAVTATTDPVVNCPNNGCPATKTGDAFGCAVVYGVAVSCARYSIAGKPGAFKLAVAGTPVMSDRAGGGGRATPTPDMPTYSCAPTGMLRQVKGAYGPWIAACANPAVINGLQFSCTDPTVPVR